MKEAQPALLGRAAVKQVGPREAGDAKIGCPGVVLRHEGSLRFPSPALGLIACISFLMPGATVPFGPKGVSCILQPSLKKMGVQVFQP